MKRIILLYILLNVSSFCYCQDTSGPYYNRLPDGSEVKQPLPSDGAKYFLLTDKETVLSYAVLFCLLVILFLEVWAINKMKIHEDNAIKLIIITLVLLGTLFIVMAGYDEKIVAPVFGLFGTIVGYLFGKSSSRKE